MLPKAEESAHAELTPAEKDLSLYTEFIRCLAAYRLKGLLFLDLCLFFKKIRIQLRDHSNIM